jgi:beta-lactamase superfamily II metal-dependent hydrolase
MHLTIFDVEHGQCALLTFDNNQRLMIDCGHNATTGWRPGDHLARLGVRTLDYLAITNYDEDHVSGLQNLLYRVTVPRLIYNPSVSGQQILSLKSDTGAGPGIKTLSSMLTGMSPVPEPVWPAGVSVNRFWNVYPHYQDENNLSLVVCLNINGVGFIFPGDLECAGWKSLLAGQPAFREQVRVADVLIASHHGRDSGICPELFDVYGCNPSLVIISDDYHQYDTQQTTAYYGSKSRGINGFRTETGLRRVLTTRRDGAINFSFNNGRCTVT